MSVSLSLHKRSISDVIVSTQHQTETTNLELNAASNNNQKQSKLKSSKSVGSCTSNFKGERWVLSCFLNKIVEELELQMCSGSEFQIIETAKENERLSLADFMLGASLPSTLS